jgi:alkylation response protein AidB-like acyl-CoA dehydrogenase
MDLDLTPEQEQVAEAMHDFLAAHCTANVVRASEPSGFDPQLWAGLTGLAGPATGVGEELGGGGASLLDLELICEQLGEFLAPVPFIEGAVAARALADAGEPGREGLAVLIAHPATVSTVALRPATGGVASLVPAGAFATMLIVMDEGDLVLVHDGAEGHARRNLGCSPLADRSIHGPDRSVLLTGAPGRRTFDRSVDEWRVLMSGALVGAGTAALALGVEYAKNRHQFGVPIGSFQSIARDLADVATVVDGARLLAREAAWAREEDEQEFSRLAAMAFLFATRAARRAGTVGLHVHGGYGFTLEYDIQLFYRRTQAWPLALGDPRQATATLADALFGPVEVA